MPAPLWIAAGRSIDSASTNCGRARWLKLAVKRVKLPILDGCTSLGEDLKSGEIGPAGGRQPAAFPGF